MIEYRFARPEEEDELLDFINLIFSQAVRPHHFQSLHSKVYAHPGFSALHAVAVENGRIRGTVAVLPLTLWAAGDALQGGYVGSVAVHESVRGQGCMHRLMEMQIEKARALGYDFLALGGRRQRYGYYGFEKAGGMICFTVTADNVRHALGDMDDGWVEIRSITDRNDDALLRIGRLHAGQTVHCVRPNDRLFDTLRTWEARLYAVRNRATGECQGYFVEKEDMIREIVLRDADDLPAVIKAWMRGRQSCRVLIPAWKEDYADIFRGFAENYAVSDAEMWKVLHWPRVLLSALAVKRRAQALPEGRFVVEIAGQRIAVQYEKGVLSVTETADAPARILTEKQAAALFFSPLSALVEKDAALRAWLPLSLAVPPPDQF